MPAIDSFTRILTAATNILFIGYPIRTALGALCGIAIDALIRIFKPSLDNLAPWIDVSQVQGLQWMVIGIVFLHIRTIWFYVVKKGTALGENEEKALEVIRRAKRFGVTDREVKQMYHDLCMKVLEKTELNQATKEEMKDLKPPSVG